MNASARAALLEAKEAALSDYVIEWAGGQKVGSVKRASAHRKRLAKVGVVSPHDFRHSAAVWMAEDGVSMSEIARYLGTRTAASPSASMPASRPSICVPHQSRWRSVSSPRSGMQNGLPRMSDTGVEKTLELAKILLSNSPEATFAQLDEVSDALSSS